MKKQYISDKVFYTYLKYRNDLGVSKTIEIINRAQLEQFYVDECKRYAAFEKRLKQGEIEIPGGAWGLAGLLNIRAEYDEGDIRALRHIIDNRDDQYTKKLLEQENDHIKDQNTVNALQHASNELYHNIIEAVPGQTAATVKALKIIAPFIKQDIKNVEILEDVA